MEYVRPNRHHASQTIFMDQANWKTLFERQPRFPRFGSESDATVEWQLQMDAQGDHIEATVKRIRNGRRINHEISVANAVVRIQGLKNGQRITKEQECDVDDVTLVRFFEPSGDWKKWREVVIECDIRYNNGFSVGNF